MKGMLLKKALLQRLVREAHSRGGYVLEQDLIMKNVDRLNISAYRVPGFVAAMDSLDSYYRASFALLEKENFESLFPADRPVYTKTYEDMPAVYGLASDVKNALVADGCIIEGEVENCILFRGCRVEKDAVVKNSILLPGCFVGEGAAMNYVIADKSAALRPRKVISGADSYPIFIGKEIQI